jgi:hypothetical protein
LVMLHGAGGEPSSFARAGASPCALGRSYRPCPPLPIGDLGHHF